MARYLTPASIGLLCLLELYVESAVPVDSTVPVLSFIVTHLLPSSLPKPQNNISGSQQREESINFIITAKDFENLLSPHPAASGLPGRSLWDAFLKKLWDINSLDALHAFFESRSKLLAKPKEQLKKEAELGLPPPDPTKILLSRTSPTGAYVRRAQVEFERLKFHDILVLWKAFVTYRQSTFDVWKHRNKGASTWSFDEALHGATAEGAPDARETLMRVGYRGLHGTVVDGAVSTNDLEKLLEFQIEQMQSKFMGTS